jgi:hypothetical protein
MSDFILKIFPVNETTRDKTGAIKEGLLYYGFISGEELDFYGKDLLEAGDKFCDYFELDNEMSNRKKYKKEIGIMIQASGYGVVMEEGAEEEKIVGRTNQLEIWGADGEYRGWDKLTQLMKDITGDTYSGDWEIL